MCKDERRATPTSPRSGLAVAKERPATTIVFTPDRVSRSYPVAAGSMALRQGRIAEALDRLHATDSWVRAFVDVAADGVVPMDRDEWEQEAQVGSALGGLAIAVKGRSGYAAPVTRRLVAAGAVPIGATSTPRGGGYQTWGFTERGPTRNPWRPGLSPGGSSAGSAAAVAAGVVELATGSDGAGSVRILAAWCSVLGYKPTTAVAPCSDPTGLATPGVLVRAPRLLRAWADTVLDQAPAAAAPGSLATVAWSDDLGLPGAELDDEVARIARAAAARLVDEAGLEWQAPVVELIDPQHAWMSLREPDATPGRWEPALRDRDLLCEQVAAVFSEVDLLMCPTTPRRPHGHDGPGEHLSVALTWGFNLTGHPAVSVPAGFTDDGAPVGLQIVARPYADRGLLALLERHVPTAAIAPIRMGRSTR